MKYDFFKFLRKITDWSGTPLINVYLKTSGGKYGALVFQVGTRGRKVDFFHPRGDLIDSLHHLEVLIDGMNQALAISYWRLYLIGTYDQKGVELSEDFTNLSQLLTFLVNPKNRNIRISRCSFVPASTKPPKTKKKSKKSKRSKK